MKKGIIIFKKCYCKNQTRRVIITDDKEKFSVYHLTKCKGCSWNTEVFPDKLINTGDFTRFSYSDGKRNIEWETITYKDGTCYLYEEEQI